jgi:peptidoglycan/xylan/chitin deacetylase (PgdA/CDA1 family)/glycosyltransferase involved in cell wall biosynthesis
MTAAPISVVLTCHNLGRWVREALDSVERQTRPAAEIVVVDDASTDLFTRQVLSRLEREGICVVRGEGRGASAARNLGARLTTADYLVWLDADDTLEPMYFAAAAAALDADADLEFVTCAKRAFGAASYLWTPSRPTFVDAVSNGGVPHASTMMRRELWRRVGGFDEALPTFELLDFWASAIERGARGIVLPEPFLNYRVRPDSGYRRSIQPSVYHDRLRHFYAKHRDSVERAGVDLLLAKEEFVFAQRRHRDMLEARAAALEHDLAELNASIAATTRALEARGLSAVDWGDLAGVEPRGQLAGRDRGTPIDQHYAQQFLNAHHADRRGRVLDLSAADLPAAASLPSASCDCIVLCDALHQVEDAPAAVRECVRALRPGGALLCTVPAVRRGADADNRDRDLWRFTEASVRTLLSTALPLDAFDVTPYGNVKACIALLHGLAAEDVAAADLEPADPASPVTLAIRAVKPLPARPRASVSRATAPNARAVVLAYHRISQLSPDAHGLCTPPDVFRDHMTYVRDACTPIALRDLVAAAAEGSIPERAVAVTLDDGYLDALAGASPILLELGVPATFFVNSGRMFEAQERWFDVLERVLLCEPTLPGELAVDAGGRMLRMPTGTTPERAAALDAVAEAAWPLDAAGRERIVHTVLAWSGATRCARASHRLLTGGEVGELANRAGHTIGAHTMHHLALTRHDAATSRREIADDKAALEALLQRPVDLFAYPYGEFDGGTVAAVREAGFAAAVTVAEGAMSPATNRFLIPRVEAGRLDTAAVRTRIARLLA